MHGRSVSPMKLCPGSPRGCCPLLPKARCVGLTEGRCQLPGALLGKALPAHPAADRALPRLGGDRGDLASAEVKVGAGTNLCHRGICTCGHILLRWVTSSPLAGAGMFSELNGDKNTGCISDCNRPLWVLLGSCPEQHPDTQRAVSPARMCCWLVGAGWQLPSGACRAPSPTDGDSSACPVLGLAGGSASGSQLSRGAHPGSAAPVPPRPWPCSRAHAQGSGAGQAFAPV